ncbi:MAG: tetratricopeptide repeat protein [Planctomycetes bacterium]|nr:tetratricopeptide repeat protein [Planctomycetota bacterium]
MQTEADKLRQALELYREGDLTRAEMLIEAIDFRELDEDLHVEANYLWGLVLTRRGDPLEAAHRFQSCIRMDQRFFPALDAWGNVLANLGDSRGAIEKYKRALAVASPEQSGHILHNYGQVLLRAGYVLKALQRFRDAFKRNPQSHEHAYMTGICYLRLKRTRGALKWMRTAVELEPKSARNHVGLGNARLAGKRYGDAVAEYERALEYEPAYADAHYNWAVALAEQKDYARAVRHCKQGLRINPDGFELLAQQAYCLRQMGAYDAALQTAKRMRQVIGHAGNADRKPEFLDVLVANEAASMRALGRNVQARNRLIEQLRESREPCPHSLAELRYHDLRRLPQARKFELTLTVRRERLPFSEEESALPPSYQRSYWVIASSLKEARRMVRELEPREAEIRFDADVVSGPKQSDVDQGVLERSPAIPED